MDTANRPNEDDDYLAAGEVANMLAVSRKTVTRWADKGLIPVALTLGGHRRFRRAAVARVHLEMYGTVYSPPKDDEDR
jgi:excisionase family DNA binding protein